MGEAAWVWKSEEEILFERLVDQETNSRRGKLDTHMADGCLRSEVEEEIKEKMLLNSGKVIGRSLLPGNRYPNGREK